MNNNRDRIDISNEVVPLSREGMNGDEPLDDISEERIIIGTRFYGKVIFNSKDYGAVCIRSQLRSQDGIS